MFCQTRTGMGPATDFNPAGFIKTEDEPVRDVHIKIEVHEIPEWFLKDEESKENILKVMKDSVLNVTT